MLRLIKSQHVKFTKFILKECDFCRKCGVKILGNLVTATICNELSKDIIESENWDLEGKTNAFLF